MHRSNKALVYCVHMSIPAETIYSPLFNVQTRYFSSFLLFVQVSYPIPRSSKNHFFLSLPNVSSQGSQPDPWSQEIQTRYFSSQNEVNKVWSSKHMQVANQGWMAPSAGHSSPFLLASPSTQPISSSLSS